jgi:hypothetical protein
MKHIPIGTIVCVVAPGSRASNGEERTIPAVVMGQWPSGNLQLYSFHFEGSPILMNDVPLTAVHMPGQTETVESEAAVLFAPRSFSL